jgi:flavin-dependent dehydrogenase
MIAAPGPATIEATTTGAAAAARVWDVVVVGAGPAGAVAARGAAGAGADVLLLDRASFPRSKVCGCCLNAAALGVLETIGLADVVARAGAQPIERFELAAGARRVALAPGRFAALSRGRLDADLVRAAIAGGAAFLPEAPARLGRPADGARLVHVTDAAGRVAVRGRVVIAADGVGGRFLADDARFAPRVAPGSRIGLGTVLDARCDRYAPGVLSMFCGADGYAGMVRLEDGRLDVAAAVAPAAVRRAGGANAAVAAILAEAGEPPDVLEADPVPRWRGTPGLTRCRPRVAADRVLVVGDAAAFVEPFTGEGIAWALATGCAVVAPARLAATADFDRAARAWTRAHRRLLRRRRHACGLAAALLRRPRLTRLAVGAASRVPPLARGVARRVNTSWTTRGRGARLVAGGSG